MYERNIIIILSCYKLSSVIIVDSKPVSGSNSSVSISAIAAMAGIGWILLIVLVVVFTAIVIYKKRMRSKNFNAL